MIVHTVLLELDPDKTAEIDAAVQGLRSLAALPGVISMSVGPDVSPENLADGFTHAAVAVFESAAARDAYLPAPEHLAVVRLLQACMRRVTVVDIEG
ncbi:hypothetical protein GCM10022234_18280 [Aeromicrobium panaciterrae]|uniref:Dabb family protein n=1 Tax=Aeromicrobium panaciterrae TaxID=363861 RepID=UPI0031D48D74